MIDIQAEQLITLNEAARLRPLRRDGRPTHVSTVYRWISRGVRGVRLEAIRIGGVTYTSREAVQRFADRLTGVSPSQAAPPSAARRRREAEVERQLAQAGL
jgi:hypothetical protein